MNAVLEHADKLVMFDMKGQPMPRAEVVAN
jgi:hypothetical protein